MVYILLALGFAFAFFMNSRKSGKRKYLLFPLFFFLAGMFYVYEHPSLSTSDTIFVMDEPSYTVSFKGKTKFERIAHDYRGIANVILTETPSEKNFVSDKGGLVYAVDGMNDMGIDTMFISGDSTVIRVSLFSGSFQPSSLLVFSSDEIVSLPVAKDKPDYVIKGLKCDSAVLNTSDDNPYNHFMAVGRKPVILIVDDAYSKELQGFSLDMQRMFSEAEFRTGFLKGGSLITLNKGYDAVISLSTSFSGTDLPSLKLSAKEINGKTYIDIENFISRIQIGKLRIKNPFNPSGKRINISAFKAFLLTIQHNPLSVLLFILILALLYLLF